MDADDAAHGPSRPIEHAEDYIEKHAHQHFEAMVESVGVKKFAGGIGLSTRQINRILAGAQPNPVNRLVKCIQSSTPETGDAVLDFLCKEAGGHFGASGRAGDPAPLAGPKPKRPGAWRPRVAGGEERERAISGVGLCLPTPGDWREIRSSLSANRYGAGPGWVRLMRKNHAKPAGSWFYQVLGRRRFTRWCRRAGTPDPASGCGR